MRLQSTNKGSILLDLDPTDCLALADCCDHAISGDMSMNYNLIAAFSAALKLGAVACAAYGVASPRHYDALTLEGIRAEWGMMDDSGREPRRAGVEGGAQ